ncbi:MAG TPA: GMC family oxidoreductase [Acidimicrobiales bacterium]|nr:GMC family oxidoreductase [Acidimicrobiales bacterium]
MKTAVVVGSGAAGSTVARLLALSGGWNVVVLEKGLNRYRGLGGPPGRVTNVFANDEVGYESRPNPIYPDTRLEPRSFRTSPSDGDRIYVGDVNNLPSTVGGGTVHFDAKARRFREVDFVANSLLGGAAGRPAVPGTTYADWPVGYRHLEPFYAVMEEIVGVQGPAHRDHSGRVVNPNPNESWRSTPHVMPPGVAMYGNLLLADAARTLGYHPAAVPTAINSRPYAGRPACNDCSFCLDYGCTVNAKGSGVWQLNDALATGRARLVSGAYVVGVQTGPGARGRRRATGVTYVDRDGRTHTQSADLVVLANSPIEAVRLSLLSGIGRGPADASPASLTPSREEPSGMLGRNLMFHLETVVAGIFDRSIHSWRGRTSTHTLDDFAGPGPTPAQFDPAVPMGGLCEIGGNYDPVSQAAGLYPVAPMGQAHREMMAFGPLVGHIAALTMQGQDMPQATNYVDLDPTLVDVAGQPVPRVTYKNHPYELAAAAYYQPRMMEIFDAVAAAHPSGPKPLVVAPLNTTVPAAFDAATEPVLAQTPFSEIPQSKHIMGTHRMALEPGGGPCDPYGRYWAFDNLYHAGGGLFVTAPGFNVTLTIWALSYWVAAAVVAGVGGQGGYTAADVDEAWPRMTEVIRRLDGKTMAARALR